MFALPRLRRWRRLVPSGTVLALVVSTLFVIPSAAQADTSLPCDIYGAAGTQCVAAHSTVRALYAGYSGRLYQIRRSSDGATTDVGTQSAGGYANAPTQDVFCENTNCVITIIYDQSPQHNDLTIEGPGAAGGQDVGSNAAALPVVAGGHKVFAAYIGPGTGYRHYVGSGVAQNGQPEGMYMVASGTHANNGCCFDYGNVEANIADNHAGHMDAVNFGTGCFFQPCSGSGPWVRADLEDGLFQGANPNTGEPSFNPDFVTALLKNDGQTTFALKGGDAQGGGLNTWYNGPLPNGYQPMHQEGSIVMGTGGDNSNASIGTFFEGVMTAGYPSDSADNAVQANIDSVGYSGNSAMPATAATVTGPAGKCIDVIGDNTGGDYSQVDIWDCLSDATDQHWTHNSDLSLSTLGRCLDIDGNGTADGTHVELWDCNGVGGQKWVQQADGSLLNPQSGRCLDDPYDNTTNGTYLQIANCNGGPAQKWSVNGGGVINAPGGQCVDVAGDDTGVNLTPVQLWNCQAYSVDQHWYHNSNGSLESLGRCLDIYGDGTASQTPVELYDCNGQPNQVWQQRPDGSLFNPQSGRCLDDPYDNTSNGTHLWIYDCNQTPAQQFHLS